MIFEIILFFLIFLVLYAPIQLLIAGGGPQYFSKLEFGLEVRSTSAKILERFLSSKKGIMLFIFLGYVPFSFLPVIAWLILPSEIVTGFNSMNFFLPTMLICYSFITGDYIGLFYKRKKLKKQKFVEKVPA